MSRSGSIVAVQYVPCPIIVTKSSFYANSCYTPCSPFIFTVFSLTLSYRLGQCGNQVGAELFSTLLRESCLAPPSHRNEVCPTNLLPTTCYVKPDCCHYI